MQCPVNTSFAFVLTLPVLVPSPLPRVSWLRMGGLATDGMGFDALAVETSYSDPV